MLILLHLLVKTSVASESLERYTVAPSTWSRRMVGRVPRTWSAKLGHLMTSTELTSESMMRDVREELSSERALALPLTRMVVFLQREMRMEWLISASISSVSPGESKLSYGGVSSEAILFTKDTYYYPLVSVQLLLRWLLRPHALRLLRLGRRRTLTPETVVTVASCRDGCARSQ